MPLPADYAERVYAGVLGKLIGVYLGRPYEGWSYERIAAELGDVSGYVHERFGQPLIVTDDDIGGTFTFLRALPDHGQRRDLTPCEIGETWLNYLIEERTILWWGGLGFSTEHTAYLRLKNGIPAPESGSSALNGALVAEQIGAQIFVDGWAMVAPGDPELAADLARRAGSVSHDGAAIHAAQLLAAMEAQAFVEPDLEELFDCGLSFIPRDSVIARLVADVRDWHAVELDWRRTRARVAERYGYDRYGGGCHVVPNHALIILGLLYGNCDFRATLAIVNACGWDTDCNAGNAGCLLGIKDGLAAIDAAPELRAPVADRLYLSSADGGRAISDAATEATHVVNIGRALAGAPPWRPRDGARFHFALPGAVHGFRAEGAAALSNPVGAGLSIHAIGPARVTTPTFIPPEALAFSHYQLLASPTLYPGQTVRARLVADPGNAAPQAIRLVARYYGADDMLAELAGPALALVPGAVAEPHWALPELGGHPYAEIGVELQSPGTLRLDWLTWDGAPTLVLGRPPAGGTFWQRAWVNGVDLLHWNEPEPYFLCQNHGTGLLIQGTREWRDYRVSTTVTPRMCASGGLAARVQGMRRFYALLLDAPAGRVRLVKALDGERTLAEASTPITWQGAYDLALEVTGTRVRAWFDSSALFDIIDAIDPLLGGGVALVCREGALTANAVAVRPA